MSYNSVYYSDYTYKESDNNAKTYNTLSSKTMRSPAQTAGNIGAIDYPRITHRTIQAVWQIRMQMHDRQRPWTQILSFAQCLQRQVGCYLRSSESGRESKRVFATICNVQLHSQRALRHQSRTTKTRQGSIGKPHGYHYAINATGTEKRYGCSDCKYDGIIHQERYSMLPARGGLR